TIAWRNWQGDAHREVIHRLSQLNLQLDLKRRTKRNLPRNPNAIFNQPPGAHHGLAPQFIFPTLYGQIHRLILHLLRLEIAFDNVRRRTVGNQSAERFLQYGIPSPDYWFWGAGMVVSAYGVDITVAYTDTSIDIAGCGNTTNCQGRFILGVTKVF
ncbi:MAG: hypothetical protein EBY18_22180, partial [Alphaproteobacteria bacterium]|nr:hypothetical protein [Alphaproteobacteria bacterium]